MNWPIGNVRIALRVLLLLSVVVEGVYLPWLGRAVVNQYPEYDWLFLPALVWSIAVVGCSQVLILIMLKLLSMTRNGRIFHVGVASWMGAMIAVTIIGCGLLVFGHVTLDGLTIYPPSVGLPIMALLAGGVLFVGYLVKRLWDMRERPVATQFAS